MTDERTVRDHLAIIVGLCGVYENRYGPDVKKLLAEIRVEAQAAAMALTIEFAEFAEEVIRRAHYGETT